MKKSYCLFIFFLFPLSDILPQSKPDSISDEVKARILDKIRHFTFSFYLDAYLNKELNKNKDTLDIIPFSSNCPKRDQFRLNIAAIGMYYTAEKVRGKLALQWGDAPNLLAAPNAQFFKSIRQANFGFRIVKDLWIDFGYIFNPLEYESMWPVLNQISTVTVGGYFSLGSILGFKLSYIFSEKFNGGLMAGNFFSPAFVPENHVAGIINLNYLPMKNLTLTFSSYLGNQALRNAQIKNNLLYNEFIIIYDPFKHFDFVGQVDFAYQTNSRMPPDTNKIASLYSGFLQARYSFLEHFAITCRYQVYQDQDGFLSGMYNYDGKTTGLTTNGFDIGLEYKPVKIGYMRMEYKYIHANKNNRVFYSGNSDYLQAIVFTTGVKF